MSSSTGGKARLLKILEILKTYSDENHPLSSSEIIDMLYSDGITVNRKAIYDDIFVLTQAGFDIINTRSPKAGYFLAERDFELPEIYLLIDAVLSAGFISNKKTKEIIVKLKKYLSVYDAKKLDKHTFIDKRNKSDNEEIYYTIFNIQNAIELNKKIKFNYIRHSFSFGEIKEEYKTFKISPYALSWVEDKYYLIGNNEKYNNLIHLRIDRIRSCKITNEKSRHFSEVSAYKNYFDVADYMNKVFNMFGGKKASVELLCKNSFIEQAIDRFGREINVKKHDDEHFKFIAETMISAGLTNWLLQFSDEVEVLTPPYLREEVRVKSERAVQKYKK